MRLLERRFFLFVSAVMGMLTCDGVYFIRHISYEVFTGHARKRHVSILSDCSFYKTLNLMDRF